MAFRPVADALASAAGYTAKDMWTPSGNYNPAGSPSLAAGNAMKATPQVAAKPIAGGGTTPFGRVTNQAPSVQNTVDQAMKLASPSFPVSGDVVRSNVDRLARGQQNAANMGLLPNYKPNPANIIKAAQSGAYKKSLWQPGGNKG